MVKPVLSSSVLSQRCIGDPDAEMFINRTE
jgi:hypothetical protein